MSAILETKTDDTGAPVTVFKPGKRSKEIAARIILDNSPIPLVTVVAERDATKDGMKAPSAKGDRRTAQERLAAKERKDAVAIAAFQPHRQGFDDPMSDMLVSALGRFCAKTWRGDKNEGYRKRMLHAGESYQIAVRAARLARSFVVEAIEGPTKLGGGSYIDVDSEAFKAAVKAAILERDKCDKKVREADEILMAMGNGLGPKAAIRWLCCDDKDPIPYHEGVLQDALLTLAIHFRGAADDDESGDKSWRGSHINLNAS